MQRRSVAESGDSWRIEMKCAFPGATATCTVLVTYTDDTCVSSSSVVTVTFSLTMQIVNVNADPLIASNGLVNIKQSPLTLPFGGGKLPLLCIKKTTTADKQDNFDKHFVYFG